MNWALLAGSLAGVLGLALVARLLGLGGGELGDEAEAMRIAEAEMPGFIAVSAELAHDRRSATVTGAGGRTLRIRQHGAQFVAEQLSSARPEPSRGTLAQTADERPSTSLETNE